MERKCVSKNERGGCEKGRAGLDYIWSQETPGSKIPMGIFPRGWAQGAGQFFVPSCLLTIPARSSVKITGYSQDSAWGYGAVSSTETHLNNLVDQ